MTETVLEALTVSVRPDTRGVARALAGVRQDLEGVESAGLSAGRGLLELGGLAQTFNRDVESGVRRAADAMANAFINFARTGELSFRGLRDVALSVVSDIASAGLRKGIGSIVSSLFSLATGAIAGRAVGGPVNEGRPFLVGERGPEIFVPSQAGRIVPMDQRQVRQDRSGPISITVNISGVRDATGVERSGAQVAAAARRALLRAQRDL